MTHLKTIIPGACICLLIGCKGGSPPSASSPGAPAATGPASKNSLVGRWGPKTGSGFIYDFTDDGHVKLTAGAMGNRIILEGVYTQTGNTMNVTNQIGHSDNKASEAGLNMGIKARPNHAYTLQWKSPDDAVMTEQSFNVPTEMIRH